MIRTLGNLEDNDVGSRIRVHFTQVEGELESFDIDYGDDVKVIVSGTAYYLPAEYPFSESISEEDYDPAVLLGVIDPWSPFNGL